MLHTGAGACRVATFFMVLRSKAQMKVLGSSHFIGSWASCISTYRRSSFGATAISCQPPGAQPAFFSSSVTSDQAGRIFGSLPDRSMPRTVPVVVVK
ncbi:hypothetical protein D3C76_1336070 [compost metagenome]